MRWVSGGLIALLLGSSAIASAQPAQAPPNPPTATFPAPVATEQPPAAPVPAEPAAPAPPAPAPPPPAPDAPAAAPAPPPAAAPPAMAPAAPPPPPQRYPANEIPPPQPPDEEPRRTVTLTISPLHLFSPIVELMGELQVANHFGVALIAGAGAITLESEDPTVGEVTATVYELGTQIVGYPLDDFESLQLGAELLWLQLTADDIAVGSQTISATGAGLAVGPLVGYKLMTRAGFSFLIQGGVEFVVVKADATSSSGEQASAEDSSAIPLFNLNLGWSF